MSMKKDKDSLIPLGKKKRVIYLDRRGPEGRRISAGTVFWGTLGILFLLYFLYQLVFVATGTYFYMIWGVAALGCGALSVFLAHRTWVERIPECFRILGRVVFGMCTVLFLAVEGLILGQFGAKPEPGAQVCIILGAQMQESGPSDVLQRRLDKAMEYLRENPDTIVIVSGGKGSNEPVSEAAGMRDYLVAEGFDPERILTEDASSNTWENLSYSGKLIDKDRDSVVIVTNNFHVFRAVSIAKKQGYKAVCGLAASTHPSSLLNNMVREFFGVLKDFFAGNISL